MLLELIELHRCCALEPVFHTKSGHNVCDVQNKYLQYHPIVHIIKTARVSVSKERGLQQGVQLSENKIMSPIIDADYGRQTFRYNC